MCLFCKPWVCVCVDFVKHGCVCVWNLYFVGVCMCGFYKVWFCVCVDFVKRGFVYVWNL
jgi:hypothetical protein